MRLIKDWMNNQHVVLADEVLIEMGHFIVTVKDSDDPGGLLLDVVEGIRKKVRVVDLIRGFPANKYLRHP
jgi:hypothetical protein